MSPAISNTVQSNCQTAGSLLCLSFNVQVHFPFILVNIWQRITMSPVKFRDRQVITIKFGRTGKRNPCNFL